MNELRIGTRGSALALAQTQLVVDALRAAHPLLDVKTRIIKTTGDAVQDKSLREIGGAGVFVKEIEFALLRGEIDISVHSAKDLPSQLPLGLTIAACLPRGDARDALVLRAGDAGTHDDPFVALPHGAKVGTGSVRRAAFLRNLRPDVDVQDIRGNVDSRLKRLLAGEFDALVLAMAGLERLAYLKNSEVRVLPIPIDQMLPAVAQGTLAIEARANDTNVLALLSAIDHSETHTALLAERAFLRGFDAGCQAPIAAYAHVTGNAIHLRGAVGLPDGTAFAQGQRAGRVDQAEAIGATLAQRVLQAGGQTILDVMRDDVRPLHGKRVVLTRTSERGEAMAVKLRALGAKPIQVPVIDHAAATHADANTFDAAMQALCAGVYDWLALTSATTAEVMAAWMAQHNCAWPARTRIAVVGEATARACEDALHRPPDLIPGQYDAASLADAMREMGALRVLLPNADIAQPALQDALAAHGMMVDRVIAYRTVCIDANETFAPADAIVFTSSSTVNCFAKQFDERSAPAVCIGVQTAQTAKDAGFAHVVTANTATEEGLIEALLRAFQET
jgi:hydroxymethylbilane synthase